MLLYLLYLTATPLILYIAYYRLFHRLASYPGPFLASFTNFYKGYQLSTLHMPDTIAKLHEQYGSVVRVGPNDLSFNSGAAVAAIYKAGRKLPKTSFYDGFTAFNPNLFGSQDEEFHSLRRRQMAHAFSLQSIAEMESYIDKHIEHLCQNLDSYASSSQPFDLSQLTGFYIVDVLGELAFSESFGAQQAQSTDILPAINDHIFLACFLGQFPELLPYLKKIAVWSPWPWLQGLFAARQKLKDTTARCVAKRMREAKSERKDLLTCLIQAVDPETGRKLEEVDINTEAFAMLVAGSHTTAGTLTLLFAHLLRHPHLLEKVAVEMESSLPLPGSDKTKTIHPIDGLEQNLPYTMACIQENFRINAVFSMPLPRKVTSPTGTEIDGVFVPQNTRVFALNHAVHHNPSIFGPDHQIYDPTRFLGEKAEYHRRHLFPFSVGHRMCIGRNMAMTNMLKVLTTVVRRYELELVDPKLEIRAVSVGISEMEGPLECRVRKRKF